MSVIPDDVMRAAYDLAATLYPSFDDNGKPFFDREDIETIASAILAERERCATLIERRNGEIKDRQEIAREIRRGEICEP